MTLIELIERIDAAETRVKELESYNERLEKQVAQFLEPVSDEEWREHSMRVGYKDTVLDRNGFVSLIAKRLEPKGENDGK